MLVLKKGRPFWIGVFTSTYILSCWKFVIFINHWHTANLILFERRLKKSLQPLNILAKKLIKIFSGKPSLQFYRTMVGNCHLYTFVTAKVECRVTQCCQGTDCIKSHRNARWNHSPRPLTSVPHPVDPKTSHLSSANFVICREVPLPHPSLIYYAIGYHVRSLPTTRTFKLSIFTILIE